MSDREHAGERPTTRQLLHAATGDRDAEAQELAERTGEDVDAARRAVREAHQDVSGEPDHGDLATPSDVHDAAADDGAG